MAVALGIGTAVFTGHGVASAEPSDTSASTSGTSQSSSSESKADTKKADAKKPDTTVSGAAKEDDTEKEDDTKDTKATKDDDDKADEEPKDESDEPDEPANKPKKQATVAVSQPDEAVDKPAADDGEDEPAPVETAAWTLAAASRREIGASQDESPAAANSVSATPVAATTVVAKPSTPLLTPLQHVPIFGPLFVTPVVAALKQVPFVGDILHPIIGYPVGFTGGTTPRDVHVISADGTAIYVHFFPAQGANTGKVAPTILNGPGLGLPGETNPLAQDNPFMPNQVIGMAPLLQGGYNVVTWDPRGEWQSGGVLQIDNPAYEGQDMKAILDWIAQQPEVQLDAPGDPRIGMVGASYGGGIQLVTAAIDHRVDAIAPTIAWNNLNTSLYNAGAVKTSWGAILTAALLLTGARVNPQIYGAVATGLFTGQITPAQQDFLDQRSPDRLLDQITAPTLLLQGTVDTLFSLQEAHDNAIALIGNGVPTKVVWFCGGHGACISSGNDGTLIEEATMNWLDRYVMGLAVSTGPQFEWVDQKGRRFGSSQYPVTPGPALAVQTTISETLGLYQFFNGSGPNLRALQAGPIGALLGILSSSRAANAVNVTLPAQQTTQYLVGAPQLEFTYSGTGEARHVYAQLVDDETGLVLGNQVTPIPVTLDGEEHVATVSLEQIAHTLEPGQTVTLQIVASAIQYQAFITYGRLTVSNVKLSVPTTNATAVAPASELDALLTA
ncbi:X-Pro dipeptidyl-peptidase (S15 family) [Mycolicibacterium rutilum]|uniref:X-Pro dipeptidyl-peptidase (S15 family) n=1 Tax=Mycolicibacterium rutilum TaxID=370526 RepID=A0A1H6IGB7_MYCRU|nr:X-Pro dipeptidyl-peptidase (S15 family) [Mycolicibacterium rutilum]